MEEEGVHILLTLCSKTERQTHTHTHHKMPIALSPPFRPRPGLTKFTNCRLLRGDKLVHEDLWVSSVSGKVVNSQAAFFDDLVLPDQTIDLGGRIVSPGFIDVQLNGAFGFNFSTLLDDMSQYGKKVKEVQKLLVQTGVTSYNPTITSQRPELYQKVGQRCCICKEE